MTLMKRLLLFPIHPLKVHLTQFLQMGEQSKEGEADEPASFDPFVRSEVEYDSTTRLHMAEDVASTRLGIWIVETVLNLLSFRRLFVSPALKDIIVNPENFYHGCQQSAKVRKAKMVPLKIYFQMAEDANQRRQVSFNTKREAFIHQLRANGLPLPSKIPMASGLQITQYCFFSDRD